jgi:hypothetical protein
VGLCFNPCAQQNSFCPGRLALIRPAVFSRSVFAGLSTGRLTAARTASASSASRCLTCPAPPEKQTHPLGGFSSRRLLRKSLTPFPWGSPASPRFPLGGYASPLFPKAVTVSCLLLRRGRNRASPAFQPISVVRWFTPEPNPTKTRARILARVFSGPSSSVHPQQHFLGGESFSTHTVTLPSSDFRPLSSDLRTLSPAAAFGKIPPLLRRRRSGSLAGGAVCLAAGFRLRRFRPSALQRPAIPPQRGQVSKLWNFFFQPLELRAEFFQPLENPSSVFFQCLEITNRQSAFANAWGPRCACPPHKMGPRALRALLFPDICREIETP